MPVLGVAHRRLVRTVQLALITPLQDKRVVPIARRVRRMPVLGVPHRPHVVPVQRAAFHPRGLRLARFVMRVAINPAPGNRVVLRVQQEAIAITVGVRPARFALLALQTPIQEVPALPRAWPVWPVLIMPLQDKRVVRIAQRGRKMPVRAVPHRRLVPPVRRGAIHLPALLRVRLAPQALITLRQDKRVVRIAQWVRLMPVRAVLRRRLV